jgi:multicomponent Na+:H+ antiporter subunit B
MIKILLVLWIISAVLIIREKRYAGLIIHLSVFSLIAALCFFLFAAPDVAMAEAVISVFSTIIYIVSFEKYYGSTDQPVTVKKSSRIKNIVLPAVFSVFLFVLFVIFIPGDTANTFLKDRYLSGFMHDIGGENGVTAIYLGYRLYDTLFEALILLVSIAAVIHLSWYQDFFVSKEVYMGIQRSPIAFYSIRIVSPLLILFSVYIMVNGHISPGGGFQGGVIAASFFISRYMIHDIYDIPIGGVIKLEKIVYAGIMLLALLFIFLAGNLFLPEYRIIYLILMNVLIGMKVACGFYIIFFRFIAFERR